MLLGAFAGTAGVFGDLNLQKIRACLHFQQRSPPKSKLLQLLQKHQPHQIQCAPLYDVDVDVDLALVLYDLLLISVIYIFSIRLNQSHLDSVILPLAMILRVVDLMFVCIMGDEFRYQKLDNIFLHWVKSERLFRRAYIRPATEEDMGKVWLFGTCSYLFQNIIPATAISLTTHVMETKTTTIGLSRSSSSSSISKTVITSPMPRQPDLFCSRHLKTDSDYLCNLRHIGYRRWGKTICWFLQNRGDDRAEETP